MPRPDLYTWHDRETAAFLSGAPAAAESLCDGQWLIFPDAALCLARLGEKPRASHFETASQFCWVAERAYEVSDRPFAEFVPAQVVGSEARVRDIHLFAQPPGASGYIYLGALEPSRTARARASLALDRRQERTAAAIPEAIPRRRALGARRVLIASTTRLAGIFCASKLSA